MKCNYCKNFLYHKDKCKNCEFEYDEDLPYRSDNWDIFSLDDDLEWSHLQILYRLQLKGVPCIFADIWTDNNLCILCGCTAYPWKIASVLNIHEEVIYVVGDTTMIVINLFMEKYLRGEESKKIGLNT